MAKYKVIVKLLVRGFPSIIGGYKIDGFTLIENKVNTDEIEESIKSENFDTRIYITSVSFQLVNEDKLTYNFFENIDYYIIDFPSKNQFEDIKSFKVKLSETLSKNEKILTDIDWLEKKMRLIYNLPIKFPIKKIFVYDEDNEKILESMIRTSMPNDNGLSNFNSDEFHQKSKFKISMKSIVRIEKKNNNFKTAMNFFYNSFDIEDKNIRFILLFSALEAIFNLRNINNNKIFKFSDETTDEEKITTVISALSSKFLFLDSIEETKEKENRIRFLYRQRGNYIHGKKDCDISGKEEKELREYVRQILIIYFMCCDGMKLKKNESMARKVLVEIYVNEKLSIMIQSFADTLRSESYKESYTRNLERVKKGIEDGKLEILEMKNGYVTKINETM